MKKLTLILISGLLFLNPAFADVLYLNEGEEIIGKLLKIEGGSILFEDLKSENKEVPVASTAHLLISRIRQGDEIDTVASLTDPVAAGIMQNLPNAGQFKNADYVTLYRLNDYEFTDDNQLIMRVREIVQILKEPGLEQANQSIYYYANREKCELEFAHTYSVEGKVYHVTDDAVSDESLMAINPEYDRIKKIKMALKKVDIGSVIDFCHIKKLSGLDELHPYSIYTTFGEREPVLHEEISISFPESMQLTKVQSQWPAEGGPKFLEKIEKGKKNWKWIYANPKGYVPEQNMLPTSRIFPRIVVYKNHDMQKAAQMLTEAYNAAKPTEALLQELLQKAKVASASTELQMVMNLYETINKDIRNVEMSITQMGSFVPVSADVTLKKKYANTQACLALLHYSLRSLGIESYPGFCAGRREQTTIKDHANLGLTDYAVLKVVIDGKSFFTDGGSIYRPFGTISSYLQGSMAAFHNSADNTFFYEELPRQTYEWNRFDRTVFVKILADGSMDVNEAMISRGPYEPGVRELKRHKDKEIQNYAERRVKRVHPRATLKSFGLSDLHDLNAPVVLNLNYTIPEAAQLASDKIMTFTNFWVNYQSGSASLASRTYPMQYWACEENQQTIIFELPESFNWVHWNRQYQHTSPNLTFVSNLNQTGNRLIYADRFTATVDEFLDDTAYQNYRQCILTMSELANQWIILEKADIVPPAIIATPTLDAASATSLVNPEAND